MKNLPSSDMLLSRIREHEKLSGGQLVLLTILLSLPSILSQFSTVAMEYIDASMLGHVGALEAASVGLVATTTWLIMGLCSALSTGFNVQVAHLIGARNLSAVRVVLCQAFATAILFSALLALVGVSLSSSLPVWLGADESIQHSATAYFMVFSLFIPMLQMTNLMSGMLRCSGNVRVPSFLNVLMCLMDVVFNFFLIFPSRTADFFGRELQLPGLGLGAEGAALGTGLAMSLTAILLLYFVLRKSPMLSLKGSTLKDFIPSRDCLKKAFIIGAPIGLERCVMNGAQIMLTTIVAPLGPLSIAANSFGITIEGLCYMPGYGISDAATTLVGQSYGAGRRRLARRLAMINVSLGMAVMSVMGALMYLFAPLMLSTMTPEADIVTMGTTILRIEAFAEPMFAAAIVSYGAFVGAGKTIVSSLMNLGSMWIVRISLALVLAPLYGLRGVWIAMCIELCFRGSAFLLRLFCTRWER